MTRIRKQKRVTYSAEKMFILVNDIEAYPDFLPWCTATNIIGHQNGALIASVSIAIGKIKQTFTTANRVREGESIVMQLVEGPFKQLYGHWKFQHIDENNCVVSLDMQFEFKNLLVKHIFGNTFHNIIDTMIVTFVGRAHAVYGRH